MLFTLKYYRKGSFFEALINVLQRHIALMKELYREIKINKPGLRFLPELSLSGLAEVVYFDLRLYFLHGLNYVGF